MKYTRLEVALSRIACALVGTLIGLNYAEYSTTTHLRKEAIAAGVAEWVTISDPFSNEKPVLEFRFKTPATQPVNR